MGQELVIGGYIPGAHGVDAIVVGYYRGQDLIYVAPRTLNAPDDRFTLYTAPPRSIGNPNRRNLFRAQKTMAPRAQPKSQLAHCSRPVAQGLSALRNNEWVEGIEERFGFVTVSVADVRVEHQVKIADFMKWLERPGRTPREITQRQRIRAILGMSVSR